MTNAGPMLTLALPNPDQPLDHDEVRAQLAALVPSNDERARVIARFQSAFAQLWRVEVASQVRSALPTVVSAELDWEPFSYDDGTFGHDLSSLTVTLADGSKQFLPKLDYIDGSDPEQLASEIELSLDEFGIESEDPAQAVSLWLDALAARLQVQRETLADGLVSLWSYALDVVPDDHVLFVEPAAKESA